MHDFAFLRPSLLPEDLRYMGASVAQIQSSAPGFPPWLARVFGVLGGYMFATGLLSVYVAEYFLVTTDQVKHVIDMTLPLFSLTSIAFVLNKTGDIGYGYFWVYSISYAVFYLILVYLFLVVGLTAAPRQLRTVPIRMYLGSISVTIICLVFCIGMTLPYLDDVFHPFRPNLAGAIKFGFMLSASGAFSFIYIAKAVTWLKDELQLAR